MQLTAADAGCWVDGHWGQYGSSRVIKLAQEFGWDVYIAPPVLDIEEDWESEFIYDLADKAEQWMNDNIAPDGHSFGWYDGEWFLWPYSTWEETE